MQINIPSLTNKQGCYIDKFGINWKLNSNGFRTIEFDSVDFKQPRALAMGCSHTMGNGNDYNMSWPEVLKRKINMPQIINLGQEGASSDYVVRIMPVCLEYFKPKIIFIFWPDYIRFEALENGKYRQILATDKNRLSYMKTHNDEWLKSNYENNLIKAKKLCDDVNVTLIGISWNDLIPVIDHADKWGKSIDGSHYDASWHAGVAETFKLKLENL